MPIAITNTTKTLKEVSGNNGAIANTVTFKAADGTFAGNNGDALGTVTGVPDGLSGVVIKTSATTAKLILIGSATAHNNLADAAANGTADNTQLATLVKTTAGTASVKQVDTITLSGQYEEGDTITLKNVATADVVYTVKTADIKASAAETAEAVSAALATAISTATGATVDAAATAANGVLTLTAKTASATALGTTAVATNRANDAPAAVKATKIPAEASVKQVDTITLSGKYEAGDTITVSGIGGETIYTVVANDVKSDAAATLAAIATKLAAQINDGAAGFTVGASATDDVVTLTADAASTAFTATASATNANGGGMKVTFATKDFATGTLTGTKLVVSDIDFDFADPADTGTLSLVPPAGADTNAIYNTAALALATTKIEGTSSADKVYIYNNGGTKPIIEVTVTDGKWSLALKDIPKIKDGVYNLTASESKDGLGAMSAVFAFTVDTKAPSAPSVTAIKGAISTTTPVLTGKAEKGASVEVFADEDQTESLGVTTADAKGVWTLGVDNAVLAAGDKTYKITAKATDAAGNTTKTKKAVDLIIDTAIKTPTMDAPTFKKNAATLTGEAEAGGTVQLYGGSDGSLALGKVIKVGKDGKWKASVKLTEGQHELSVIATDVAGNVSDNSVAKLVTIDTATAVPTLELVKTGDVLTGLKGTAEAGASVKITIGGEKDKFTAIADANGKWTQDLSTFTPVKLGKLKITAIAEDAAKNVSKASTAVEYTFVAAAADTIAPKFVSAETSTDGKTVILTYDENLGSTAPDKSTFAVKSGTAGSEAANAVTAVAVSGKTVTLTLTTTVTAGQSVKVGYTAPTADTKATNAAIQDTAGNDAVTLVDTTVVDNKVGAAGGADNTAPTFASAETSADGTQIVLTYSEALHATTAAPSAFDIVINGAAAIDPTSVAVSGTKVTLTLTSALEKTDIVTVAYTAPTVDNTVATNAAVQDTAGNDAAALTAQAVTNKAPVLFNAADVTAASTIATYVLADDTILLSKAAFTALTTTTGALTAGEFASVADAAALATSGTVAGATDAAQIIYLANTGALYYNADGATAGGLTLIGTFTDKPVLVAGEFSVIT